MTDTMLSDYTYTSFTGVPLKDILQQWDFSECKVLAGEEGLLKKVKWAHCSDMPNVVYWLRGNELLFHTGKHIDKMDLIHLIRQLHHVNATGLGLVMAKPELPHEIFKLAEELQFPIIYVPDQYRFVDITFSVSKILFSTETRLSSLVEKFWSQVREGGMFYADIEQQIAFIADFLKTPVALYDQNLLIDSSPRIHKEGAARLEVPETISEIDASSFLTFRVSLNHKNLGNLVIPIPHGDQELTILHRLLPHISYMLAVTLDVTSQDQDIRFGLRMSLFERCLKATEDEMKDLFLQAKKLQVDLTAESRIVTLSIPSKLSAFLGIKSIIDMLNRVFEFTPLFATFEQSIKLLIPYTIGKEQLKKNIRQFQFALSAKKLPNFSLQTGIGNLSRGIKGLQESSDQSDIALDCAKDGDMVWYENLRFWEILKNNADMSKTVSDLERRLASFTALEKNKLIETVSALIHTNFNYSEASRALGIHRNGLRERLKRYSLSTGCDFDRAEEIVSIWLIIGKHKEESYA